MVHLLHVNEWFFEDERTAVCQSLTTVAGTTFAHALRDCQNIFCGAICCEVPLRRAKRTSARVRQDNVHFDRVGKVYAGREQSMGNCGGKGGSVAHDRLGSNLNADGSGLDANVGCTATAASASTAVLNYPTPGAPQLKRPGDVPSEPPEPTVPEELEPQMLEPAKPVPGTPETTVPDTQASLAPSPPQMNEPAALGTCNSD